MMMGSGRGTRRRVAMAVIAALAVVGGSAAWLIQERGETPIARPNDEPTPTAESAASSVRAPVSGTRPVAVEPFHDVDESAIETDPAQGLLVCVVERDTNAPVAGADVWIEKYVADREESVGASSTPANPDLFARIQNRGRHVKTGPDGTVRIKLGGATGTLFARSGSRHDFAFWYASSDRTVTLRLRPDTSLRVRVVDPDGKPIHGAEVVATWRDDRNPDERRRDEIFARARSVAPDGVATFHNLDRLASAVPATASLGIALDFPSPPTVRMDVKTLAQLVGDVTLTSPALGQARVVVRGASGPIPDVIVALRAEESPAIRATRRLTGDDGVATFTSIPIGSHLVVEASTIALRSTGAIKADGPSKAAETVTIDLNAGEPFPTVRARAFDDRGSPLVRTRLVYDIARGAPKDTNQVFWPVLTDDEGSFAIPVRDAGPDADLWLQLGQWEGVRDLRTLARAPLPADAGQKGANLGTLLLTPLPLVARGVVVDETGAPIPSASLTFSQAEPTTDGQPEHWRTLFDLSRTADDRGRFEVHAPSLAGELRVGASSSDSVDQTPVTFQAGATDLTVVVTRGCRLNGRVVLEPDVPIEAIRVRIAVRHDARGAEEPGVTQLALPLDRGGAFTLWPVHPGTATVTVTPADDSDPLVTIDGIELRNPGVNRDARLDPIDARGLLKRIQVTVVDSAGVPIDGARVNVIPGHAASESREGRRPARTQSNGASLLIRASGATIVAMAPGHRAVTLEGVTSDVKITLPDPLAITVTLRDPVPALAVGESLRASLAFRQVPPWSLSATDLLFGPSDGVPPDHDGRWVFPLGVPGRFSVRLQVVYEPPGAAPLFADWLADGILDVRDEPNQSFAVTVGQDRLDAARARLRPK